MDDNDIELMNSFGIKNEDVYRDYIKLIRAKAVSWDDLVVSEKVHPELEDPTLVLIHGILGYLPPRQQIIKYEPFIRLYVEEFKQGKIDFDTLCDEAEVLLSDIFSWHSIVN